MLKAAEQEQEENKIRVEKIMILKNRKRNAQEELYERCKNIQALRNQLELFEDKLQQTRQVAINTVVDFCATENQKRKNLQPLRVERLEKSFDSFKIQSGEFHSAIKGLHEYWQSEKLANLQEFTVDFEEEELKGFGQKMKELEEKVKVMEQDTKALNVLTYQFEQMKLKTNRQLREAEYNLGVTT